jgi:hypothetical protein
MKKHRKTLVHAAFSELRSAVLTGPGRKCALLRCVSSNDRPSSTDEGPATMSSNGQVADQHGQRAASTRDTLRNDDSTR